MMAPMDAEGRMERFEADLVRVGESLTRLEAGIAAQQGQIDALRDRVDTMARLADERDAQYNLRFTQVLGLNERMMSQMQDLARAQQSTEERLQRLIDSLAQGRNGH